MRKESKEVGNPTTVVAAVNTIAEDSASTPSKATFSIPSHTKSSTAEQVMSQGLKIFLEN